MKKLTLSIALFLFAALLSLPSCSSSDDAEPLPLPGLLKPGSNSIQYTFYTPLANKPVTLYYHIPVDCDMRTMPILFAMHGADRMAEYQIDTWRDIANERQIMVFAPHFSSTHYPANRAYQYGGVSNSDYSWLEVQQEQWTISLIENMFDFIKQQTGNSNPTYDLWGHSAGGQFTHRLMFHLPKARIRMAIASNSGSYMVPSLEGYGAGNYSYPHSLRGTQYKSADIAAYFARNMVVHIGTRDLCTDRDCDSSLPVSLEAVAQGPSRYERGKFFYNYAKNAAAAAGVPFNWQLIEVVGVSHSSRNMARTAITGAADLLYSDRL